MGKVKEHIGEFEAIGAVFDRIVRDTDPDGYIEWHLRQAIADAMRRIGRDKVIEVINEEIAA